jgi:hypothetical protein
MQRFVSASYIIAFAQKIDDIVVEFASPLTRAIRRQLTIGRAGADGLFGGLA